MHDTFAPSKSFLNRKATNMLYFMYSPVDMSEYEALTLAEDYLDESHIVRVISEYSLQYIPLEPGQRPQALPDTYLVRVEPDGSLRIVQKALT